MRTTILVLFSISLSLGAQDYNAKAYEDFPFVKDFENLWTTYDRVMAEKHDSDWSRVFFYE